MAISVGDIFSSSLSPSPFLCLYSHDVRRLSCVENNRDKNSSDLFRESANERKTEERIAKRRGVKNEEEREKERKRYFAVEESIDPLVRVQSFFMQSREFFM